MIPYIDLHCDTLSRAQAMGKTNLQSDPDLTADLRRLSEGGALAQFFAVWMPPEKEKMACSDEEYIDLLITLLEKNLRDTFRPAQNAQDLETSIRDKVLSAVLALEDCRYITDLSILEALHARGFRSFGLTWNSPNAIGFPNSRDPVRMQQGLTPFGMEVLEWLSEKPAIIDVSHLSDGGFWDVVKRSRKPFLATHSNARAITPHPRNLADDMIRALAEKGGVMGLNFCCRFLGEDPNKNRLEDHIAHLNHIKNVGGEDVLALGSDLDGISGELAIPDTSRMPRLFEALRKAGWSMRQIEKFAYKNALRALGDIL